MTTPRWTLDGQYYETCDCDFVCPCIVSQLTAPPTNGSCTFAMAYQIERGRYGDLSLDGLGFVVVVRTPEEMIKGNWAVGLVIDERATAEQRDALTAIVTGTAGGPMAAIGGLVGDFLGVETAAVRFERSGVRWSVSAGELVDMGAEGAMGLDAEATEPLHLGNTGHPAADRLALCRASKSHGRAFGLAWDDVSGKKNGFYAPFAWQGA